MTLCLSMIVRDEAAIIARCLASVRDHIDSWAIVDTGSTDGTQALVRECLAGIPGELVERPWSDFATARNQARDLARGADYLLTIDADEVLTGSLPPFTHDIHSAPFLHAGRFGFVRPLILRTAADWTWRGVVHERPVGGTRAPGALDGVLVRSHTDGARARDPQRHARDAQALAAVATADPTDAYSTGHAAKCFYAAGDLPNAYDWYQRRLGMGGDVWATLIRLADLSQRLGRPLAETIGHLSDALEREPARAAWTLYDLARAYSKAGDGAAAFSALRRAFDAPAPPFGADVDIGVYLHRIPRDYARTCLANGMHAEAARARARLSRSIAEGTASL